MQTTNLAPSRPSHLVLSSRSTPGALFRSNLAASVGHAVALLLGTAWLAGCTQSSGGGSSEGAITFSKSFGGTAIDLATDAVETPDGGYVFVGSHNGRAVDNVVVDEDLWVTKLDPLGDVEWSRVYTENQTSVGASPEEDVHRIATARVGGGFFVVGTRSDLPSLDQYGVESLDLLVTRLDEDGNTLWTEAYGFPSLPLYPLFDPDLLPSEQPTSAQGTPDGGLLVGGVMGGAVRYDGRRVTGQFAFAVKISAAGLVSWQRIVEHDAYLIPAFRGSGVHVRRTADDGAILAVSSDLPTQGFNAFRFTEATRLVRFDATGSELWSKRYDEISVIDLDVFTRDSANSEEGFFLTVLEHDDLSDDDNELRVLDAQGEEIDKRGVGELGPLMAAAELTAAGSGNDFFCAAGQTQDDQGNPQIKVQLMDDLLEPYATVELDGYHSLFELRSFDDGAFAGFELLVSNLTDPQAGSGDLFNIRIDTTGSIIRNTRYPREVPAFHNLYLSQGTRLGGWSADGSTDYWLWEPRDASNFALGSELRLFHLTAGLKWSQVFSDSLRKRVERALQVEVIVDPERPHEWELAVLGEVAFDRFANPPGPDEPLSAWFLRLDRHGDLLSQRVLDQIRLSETPRGPDADWPFAPRLRRSASLMAPAADGGFFVGGHVEGYDRVVRIDAAGDVVWATKPLAPTDVSGIETLITAPDDGALAVGRRWAARVSDAGELLWRRTFDVEISGACATPEGFILGHSLVAPGALGISDTGELLWQELFDLEEAVQHDRLACLAPTLDGGAVMAFGKHIIDDRVVGGQVALETWVLRLVKIAADGTLAWSQSYGGLLEESVGNLALTADGGLLFSGRSNSLGVDSEAWLLRTDSCGEISPNCAAAIERFEPAEQIAGVGAVSFPYNPIIPAADDVAAVVSSLATTARSIAVEDLTVARQCSGISKDEPPVDETDVVQLTVVVASGSGAVFQTGAVEGGIDCPNVCTASFPRGTVVELSGVPDFGFDTPTWSGGDCGAGARPQCSVTMNADRTVRVNFPDDGGVYTGEFFDLTIDINGPGQGSVRLPACQRDLQRLVRLRRSGGSGRDVPAGCDPGRGQHLRRLHRLRCGG